MDKDEFEFYAEIKRVGKSSSIVLIPKKIMKLAKWEKGDELKLRGIKIEDSSEKDKKEDSLEEDKKLW